MHIVHIYSQRVYVSSHKFTPRFSLSSRKFADGSRMVRGSSRASSRKFAQVRASSRKFAQVRGQFADAGWFAQVRVSSRTVRASSRAVREVRAHSELPYTIVHRWFSKFSLMVHKDSQQVHASSHLFSTENLRTYTMSSPVRASHRLLPDGGSLVPPYPGSR